MTQKLNILVVDDEASVSASILWALKPFGHTTKVVTDGEQGLANLAADPTIDLVITDHSMPKMNGIELQATARDGLQWEDPRTLGAPVAPKSRRLRFVRGKRDAAEAI